ncbi:hypothetical protein [Nitratidesulfovibrio termitidis]|uniref:hypothetical protein n=1 Tax=Nitratidesulfovibrio termitidis TaxID=42252 RepID=UPI00042852BD|nr:hypothetical protein [Nitratidesulfovibrio termitidis]
MVADKIRDARLALGVLAGKVSDDEWGLIRCIQNELDAAAGQVETMEQMFPVPGAPEDAEN